MVVVVVVVNGPKTWSLAASLHPEIATADASAQERAAGEIIGWLAENFTTRIGPRGRQVQVSVAVEAALAGSGQTSTPSSWVGSAPDDDAAEAR